MEFEVNGYRYSQNNRYAGWRMAAGVARYLLTGSGLMSEGSFEIGLFPQTAPGSKGPDAQILLVPYTIDVNKHPLGTGDTPQITFSGFIAHPNSRGSLHLRSTDALDPPIIRTNYLSTDHDREVAVGTARFIRRLVATQPLRDVIVREVSPGPSFQSDDEILEAWRKHGGCGYHAIGTCAMGSDSESVTDPELRVRGIAGLRVMDTSILPYMVSGNTNAPMLAMARRAADLILEAAKS
jgi:choline dehydrogenase-like flavoprotein